MQVTFWGTRGSIAAPGPRTVRYGGNTSCVEIRSDQGTLIVCDSGTGIRELGHHLMAEGKTVRGHLFFSHTHWDHIQGWSFFLPAFVGGNEFTLHAFAGINLDLERVLANQMEYTYFPVTLNDMSAKIGFDEIREGKVTIDDVTVTAHYLNHTSVCLGYRFEADGKTVVYASDTEPHGLELDCAVGEGEAGEPRLVHQEDRRLTQFVAGADLLILDAQYTDEEYPEHVGWGHSTTSYATDVGVIGHVKRLALFHHDPTHSDESVDAIVGRARRRAAEYSSPVTIFGAAERQTLRL